MWRCLFVVVASFLILLSGQSVQAQPEDRDGPRRSGDRRPNSDDREYGSRESGGREYGSRESGSRESGEREEQGRGRRARRQPQRSLLFETLDLNSDGTISKVELRKAAAALKKLDTDKDGEITRAEAVPQRDGPGPERMGRGGPEGERGEGPRGEGRGRRGRGNPEEFVKRALEYDENNDGKLTPAEVPEQLMPMLKGGDTNQDGAVDARELEAIAAKLSERGGRAGRGGERNAGRGGDMVERMMQSDANGDGRLTPDEVPERARGMLQGADANGDGALDRAELTEAVEKMREQFRGGRDGGQRGPGAEGERPRRPGGEGEGRGQAGRDRRE